MLSAKLRFVFGCLFLVFLWQLCGIIKFGRHALTLSEITFQSTKGKHNKDTARPPEDEPLSSIERIDKVFLSHKNATKEGSTAAAAVSAAANNSCLHLNSKKWLNSKRAGNAFDPQFDQEFIRKSILDIPSMLTRSTKSLLEQSLCVKQSRFLNDQEQEVDEKSIRLWAIRLIYLAVHYHQHRLAIAEAKVRYERSSTCGGVTELEEYYNVTAFDYECPDAKYLVMSLGGIGIGANVRGGTVTALLLGLITDRIVLFLNNAPGGKHQQLKNEWSNGSCDRRDYQCFFMPPSPCVPTAEELDDAWYMDRPTSRQILKRKLGPPKEHQDIKVWIWKSQFFPYVDHHPKAAKVIYNYATTLIDALPPNDPRIDAMRKGAESILVQDEKRLSYNYAAANSKINHALAIYSMRPLPEKSKQLATIANDIIPIDLNPETSFGLPIRGSDKCGLESDCLTFDEYLQITSQIWSKHLNATTGMNHNNPTIIFTTESKDIVAEQKAFVAAAAAAANNNKNLSAEQAFHKYGMNLTNFVTNTHDITPDTGFLRGEQWLFNADDAMLSSMSSLQAQLMARVSIGNCCSNFHVLLNDFLSEGCGAASEHTFVCINSKEIDITLRICCAWHPECKAARVEARKAAAVDATAQ